MNYYNEFDPKAAAWLRELIKEGHIPDGWVDERSIIDVKPHELTPYTQHHFFAGIGGWPLALQLAGWPASKRVCTGSCPCQPFSAAGKGLGSQDERHLWPEWLRIIRECRLDIVFGEQVASAVGHQWLDLVSTDLEKENHAVGAVVLGAHSVRAPHIRQRLYFVSHSNSQRDKQPWEEPCRWKAGRMGGIIEPVPWDEPWESALSRFRVVGDGLPRLVAATDGARNAIVPQVAAEVVLAFIESRYQ